MPLPTSRRATVAVVVPILVMAVAGCGADESASTADRTASTPSTSAASSPSSTPASPQEAVGEESDLAVVVDGETITPNARAIEVGVGEPLQVTVAADRAGELHVHSKPEQYLTFEPGEKQFELVVETPGSVEVEDDDTGDVVALLEVS